MPGASAATQSHRCGSSPKLPDRVGTTMLTTSSSANIVNGKRILSCMGDRPFDGSGLRRRQFTLLTSLGSCFVNFSNHVEGAFRKILEFISQDAFAAIEGIFQADSFPRHAAELLSGEKRLGQAPFESSRARDYLAIRQ